jgi:hypothetical protein
MARKFLTPINLNQLELQNAVIQNLGSDPGTGVEGQLYYNSNANELRVYDGANWLPVGSTEAIGDALDNIIVDGTGISTSYNDGAGTLTIPDGVDGQIKVIVMVSNNANHALTINSNIGHTSIVFNRPGRTATLMFLAGNWYFLGGTATVT